MFGIQFCMFASGKPPSLETLAGAIPAAMSTYLKGAIAALARGASLRESMGRPRTRAVGA